MISWQLSQTAADVLDLSYRAVVLCRKLNTRPWIRSSWAVCSDRKEPTPKDKYGIFADAHGIAKTTEPTSGLSREFIRVLYSKALD